MADEEIFMLGASQISISDGAQLSGITQGDGSHLVGRNITLNSNSWQIANITDNEGDFGDSDDSQVLNGAQTFDGVAYADGLRVEAEFGLLVEDPLGNTYYLLAFNVNEPGVSSYSTVEGLAFVGDVAGFPPTDTPLKVIGNYEGPSYLYTDLATPPCFTRGCLIATPDGARPVEALEVGDMVQTLDHGAQPIRWIGRTRLPATVLEHHPEFRPVIVKRHSFGTGKPYRDTRFSPQHRLLVNGWRAQLLFGEDEVLVPVKKLTNDRTIITDPELADVEYVHLLLDRHEVLFCDGIPTESLLTADIAGEAGDSYRETRALLGDLPDHVGDMRAARPCVGDKRIALLQDAL
ncbi:Hint domain-containing protein [Celeribacter arenosi]|uniref:Hedgehog/Intein (Hint) domain-containing protein n=1 Tax=Celeribacter arenosi TaxID=792649 RepID=A0ABP7KF06_9RHOB